MNAHGGHLKILMDTFKNPHGYRFEKSKGGANCKIVAWLVVGGWWFNDPSRVICRDSNHSSCQFLVLHSDSDSNLQPRNRGPVQMDLIEVMDQDGQTKQSAGHLSDEV
jgi:hypothetical protein